VYNSEQTGTNSPSPIPPALPGSPQDSRPAVPWGRGETGASW
jgi:hypothetical protein